MSDKVPAIELRGITKRFGSVVANDKVDLIVKKGEILAILGENGSGKTTLMNMISGIYYPDEGEILIDGKEVKIRSPKDSFNYKIGMIHQHFKLIDVFTAAENIVLGIEEKGKYDIKKATKEIQETCDKYGFKIDLNKKIYEMSVSEKQKTKPEEKKDSETEKPMCILSVRCDDILNHMDKISENKMGIVPENGIILENLQYLSDQGCSIEIRYPLVKGYNDGEAEKIGAFLKDLNITKIKVLQYHHYAGSRYDALGMENTLPDTETTMEDMEKAVEILKSYGLNAVNGAKDD